VALQQQEQAMRPAVPIQEQQQQQQEQQGGGAAMPLQQERQQGATTGVSQQQQQQQRQQPDKRVARAVGPGIFTTAQLEVLRNQIFAFRRLKVQIC
jgi:hypothetical protein